MTRTSRALTDPLAEWACRRIKLEGRPFSFVGHEYLRGIYDDRAPHVVLLKAAQIGGSTWSILKSVHACASGLNVVYYFPTKTDVNDFSRSRVGPMLEENAFLGRLMKKTDTIGLKKIGDAWLFMRGMVSKVALKSVPADMIVLDELDEVEPESKSMAKERLSHSDFARIVELSNPSIPEYGVDEAYQASDQRHWTIKCTSCGEWTVMEREFPMKLGEEVRIILPRQDGTFYRACAKCSAELDVSAGEWVADFPQRPTHGYLISQLISSKVDPGQILHDYRTTRYPTRFYNLKIGVAWADLERRLDVSSVLSLCGEAPMLEQSEQRCTMGVDTGSDLHVVILREGVDGKTQQLVHLAVCKQFSDLARLMKAFRVWNCAIDGLPETHATREFALAHRGKVHMCFFVESQRGEPKWNQEAQTMNIHRTDALDASRKAIRDRLVALPRQVPIVEEFARHMTCDAKVLEEDEETGAKRYKYIRTGEDHFSLAFTYAWLAATAFPGANSWLAWVRKGRRPGEAPPGLRTGPASRP